MHVTRPVAGKRRPVRRPPQLGTIRSPSGPSTPFDVPVVCSSLHEERRGIQLRGCSREPSDARGVPICCQDHQASADRAGAGRVLDQRLDHPIVVTSIVRRVVASLTSTVASRRARSTGVWSKDSRRTERSNPTSPGPCGGSTVNQPSIASALYSRTNGGHPGRGPLRDRVAAALRRILLAAKVGGRRTATRKSIAINHENVATCLTEDRRQGSDRPRALRR